MFKTSVFVIFMIVTACRNSPDEPAAVQSPAKSIVPLVPADDEYPTETYEPEAPTLDVPERVMLPSEADDTSDLGLFLLKAAWAQPPKAYQYNDVTIQIAQNSGTPFQTLEIEDIEVWMKIHGHGLGNSEPVIEKISESKIEIRDIYFIMPGPWEINFTLKVDGESDDLELEFEVGE